MKKILLLIVLPLAFLSTSSAQMPTQQRNADRIVWERMNQETQPYTVYTKGILWEKVVITTSSGEILELEHPYEYYWRYYISYANNTGLYLIVEPYSDNLIEINATSDTGPSDLAEWGIVQPLILEGTPCFWNIFQLNEALLIINSDEEFDEICPPDDSYPEIDFSKNTLLCAQGGVPTGIVSVIRRLEQISIDEYILHVDVTKDGTQFPTPWRFFMIVPKLSPNAVVTLNVNEHY